MIDSDDVIYSTKEEVDAAIEAAKDAINETPIDVLMEEYATIKEALDKLAAAAKPLETQLGKMKDRIKTYVALKGPQTVHDYKFEIRTQHRVSVASWMADRVRAGEKIPGLSITESSAMYVTRKKE